MSKEQIKIICDDARTITDNDHKVIRCHINVKHFDWLIDRARELEDLKDAFDDLDSDYIDLQEQNKRYREALELLNRVSASDMKDEQLTSSHFVLDITGDALEGEGE